MDHRGDDHHYLRGFIKMLEHLDEPWGIKDTASKHIYMNQAAFLYTNTPLNFDIEGQLDKDFPASWAECNDDFQEHDRRTEESRNRVAVIETHFWFGREYMTPFISEKIPVCNAQGKCVGVLWNAKPFDTSSPINVILDHRKPSVLTTEITSTLFTKAELDTIFLMLQNLNAKEIATLYDKSVKTIESRIYAIYQKAQVHSLKQFKDYCFNNGIENYIPAHLLKKGVRFI